MQEHTVLPFRCHSSPPQDPLTAVLRPSVQRLLAQAIDVEVADAGSPVCRPS